MRRRAAASSCLNEPGRQQRGSIWNLRADLAWATGAVEQHRCRPPAWHGLHPGAGPDDRRPAGRRPRYAAPRESHRCQRMGIESTAGAVRPLTAASAAAHAPAAERRRCTETLREALRSSSPYTQQSGWFGPFWFK